MGTDVRVIGVPMDLGADRRGVDMGPSAIRYGGLDRDLKALGATVVDGGDVSVPHPERRDSTDDTAHDSAKYLPEVESVCRRLSVDVADAVAEGELPLVLGGDHSIAIGSVGGLGRYESLGVVWFDAHADLNTPSTSPSGNVHGMPLAAVLGQGEFADCDWANAPNVAEENVAVVGLRSVDEGERQFISRSDVTAYTMADVDERGITAVVADAIEVAAGGTDGVHVSLDLDWLDPGEAPGVGTPVRGGVSYREAHAAMEVLDRRLAREGDLRGFELVEVNPILDRENETGELAVELAASALGRHIL